MSPKKLKYDEIGFWSEIKLDIIKKYADAYSKIMSSPSQQRFQLKHVYIDAFAGAGKHISKKTGEMVAGSPLNALYVEPPFKEYHFIDLDEAKVGELEKMAKERSNVRVYHGDCNKILLEKVIPTVKYEDYKRGLCLLDPYGLHLDWNVICSAAKMNTIEIFLNFPIHDINRNVLRKNPDDIDKEQAKRLTMFWGDESWMDVAYSKEGNLFAWDERTTNQALAKGFCKRLKDVAGYKCVPEPLPMVNSNNAIIYYVIFASQNKTGASIANDIFKGHR